MVPHRTMNALSPRAVLEQAEVSSTKNNTSCIGKQLLRSISLCLLSSCVKDLSYPLIFFSFYIISRPLNILAYHLWVYFSSICLPQTEIYIYVYVTTTHRAGKHRGQYHHPILKLSLIFFFFKKIVYRILKGKFAFLCVCSQKHNSLLGAPLPGFRSCNPPWLRLSKKTLGPWPT